MRGEMLPARKRSGIEADLIKPASMFMVPLAAWLITSPAAAQHRARQPANSPIVVCDLHGCSDRDAPIGARNGSRAPLLHAVDANVNEAVVGGRPAGCPTEFCGRETSLYVFGEIRRELNLASAWMRKFPRAQPAPGMAVVRNHHVMILMRHVDGKDWLVHDGNSGGRKTREHIRSISGYVVVDPHGTRAASAD